MVRTDDISVALRDHNGPGVAPGKKSNYYRLGHYAPARGQESEMKELELVSSHDPSEWL